MSRHCNLHTPGAAVRSRASAAFAALALAVCGVASGQSLTPGSSVATFGTSLAASPNLAGTTPIPDDVRLFSLLTPDGAATGTLTQWVVHSVDNTYDFYWVVHNDAGSLGRVDSLTIQNFMQDPTSLLIADFRLDDFGSVGSSSATRSPGDGSKIEFSFLGGLAPGETSHALLLDSKALAFSHDGFATLGGLDGGLSASFGTAVPTVPEPSTARLLMLCMGLGAFGAWTRRHAPLQWWLRGK